MGLMTLSELTKHLELINLAEQEDWDEFLEDLLEEPYECPDQQNN